MNSFFCAPKGHKFEKVSKRGRAAYLNLCFEECLVFYGESITDWTWVLKELWEITSTEDIERWVKRVCDLTPESVLPYDSYQDMMDKIHTIGYWYELSEDNFICLQHLYRKKRANFRVISDLIDKIYGVIVDDWGHMEEPFTPSCLHNIDEAEEIMKSNNIPLPSNYVALKFIMEHEDKHYGKAFDGIQYSIIRETPLN
ncbi:hypothetical protein D7V91_12025 [bacterium 1xD42-67]|nr:hypothetical protein D7V91_12025 [bacterium 1xD42-67]